MLVVVLGASTARADDGVRQCETYANYERCGFTPTSGVTRYEAVLEKPRLALAGDVGLHVGGLHYDGETTLLAGAGASLGVSYGRFALLGDFSDDATSAPQPVPLALGRGSALAMSDDTGGELRRYGLRGRLAFFRHLDVQGDDVAELSMFVDAGVGHEHVDWNIGGVDDRDDAIVGIGWRAFARTPHERGLLLELSMIITRRYNDGIPACGGPCQMATLPSSIDRSLVIDLRYVFGG